MNNYSQYKPEITEKGFTTIDSIYTINEVERILALINQTDTSRGTFRKSEGLFAIRQFLKEVPEVLELVFNNNLKAVIRQLFGTDFFVVKSIYFDKPKASNWFVAYHQDLTISVDKKVELDNFGPWTVKQKQFAVQPPIHYLERIFTLRIHLDDTDAQNGALKVIEKSHLNGIYRPETIDWTKEAETVCEVKMGGIMIMKPLLLHSSSRTLNNKKRRVIHIEFSDQELPEELKWAEKQSLSLNQ